MRTNAKIDINQPEIVKALRDVGATVKSVAQLKNCFDILVGYRGVTYIMEIKNPERMTKAEKADHALALTGGEYEFMATWNGGTYHIVTTTDEALRIIGAIE